MTLTESGTGLSQTYAYDRWGNRAVTAGWVAGSGLTPQALSAYTYSDPLLRLTGVSEAGGLGQIDYSYVDTPYGPKTQIPPFSAISRIERKLRMKAIRCRSALARLFPASKP